MSNELQPRIGQWYSHRDKGQMFCVVAADEFGRTIEVQHFDGDVEEIEPHAWRNMDLELAEPPEDWTGPYDDVELNELRLSDTCMTEEDWRVPLELHRAAELSLFDEPTEDLPLASPTRRTLVHTNE
jgi:hypothetical protein